MKYLIIALLLALTTSAHAQFFPFQPVIQPGYGYQPGFNGFPGFNPGGGWGQQPQQPPAPYLPGISRAEAINFEFTCLRPSAALKLRITRTAPEVRKVLYQRALFVMKHDTDNMARATADWVRQQIEAMPQGGCCP